MTKAQRRDLEMFRRLMEKCRRRPTRENITRLAVVRARIQQRIRKAEMRRQLKRA